MQVAHGTNMLLMPAQVIEGCDVNCSFKGLDVMPLISTAEPATAPQRLRVNGRARFAGRVEPLQPKQHSAQEQQSGSSAAPSLFSGVQTCAWCHETRS